VERFEKDFDTCPHELAVSAASLPVRVFGWSVERRHPGVVWSTLGVVSASAIHFLKEPSGLIGKSLQTLSPDLLVVAFGLNVSNVPTPPSPEEARGLERILAEYQAANPDGACLVMSPYPIAYAADDQVLASPSTALLVAQQRRVARARGCAFLDRLDLEGGAEKALEWLTSQPKLLSADNVHLTHSGAEKVGGDVARLLLRQLADGHGG
jgi:lysophospholipase L1-like esterase